MSRTADREARLLRDEFYDESCGCSHGWVQVHPKYAEGVVPGDLVAEAAELERRVAERDALGVPDPTLAEAIAQYGERRRLRLLWAEAVYPCPDCRPIMYRRWRAGCYRANHSRKRCRVCGPDAVEQLEADPATAPAGEEF